VRARARELTEQLRERGEAWLDRVRRHRVLGEIWELLEGTLEDYVRGHGLMYAGAVAFFAVLSVIPLIVLFASGAGYAMHYVGGDSPAEMDQLLHDVMMQFKRAVPYVSDGFEDDLRRIIDNRGGLGVFSLGALLLTASQVFRALEYAFAHVFADVVPLTTPPKRRRPRNVLLSKLLFGAFIASVLITFLAVRFVFSILGAFLEKLPPTIAHTLEGVLRSDSVFGALAEAFVVIGGFAILLKWFTDQRVLLRFAAVGGVVFYLLWHAARLLYEFYLDRWSELGALYGSFTAVFWIFYSATLLLACGHLVKTVQRRVLHGPVYPKDGGWLGDLPEDAPADDANEPE
jgi:uncharacterized BrkB/YihY/UPF0761 family membrane protein